MNDQNNLTEELKAQAISQDEELREEKKKISLYKNFIAVNSIDPSLYQQYNVKRGLRNSDSSGVIAGVTNISNVHGYMISDGFKVADEGKLLIRGYDLYDLLSGDPTKRFGFEEVAYLLLMGELPTKEQLDFFISAIDAQRDLPEGFTVNKILSTPSRDIMNLLARSVLTLYANDDNPEDRSFEHEIHTAVSLLSRLPRISVLAYYAMRSHYHRDTMVYHHFLYGESTAETILSALRPDRKYTPEEARMLDIMLALHAEHGGGNNSTFTCRVLTSADTDPYSAYAGAIGSLKGRKHGGANHQVAAMQEEIKQNVSNWENDDEVADYLAKILRKEAYDHTGLVYGMGHAVYTKSDPRAIVLKEYATKLAAGTEYEAELNLLKSIERLAPEVILDVKGTKKDMCANVDMYSGFVYRMLGIPADLITPLFACGRMAGWAAHRFEELVSGKRIIRPAYKTATEPRAYVPIEQR